MSLRHPANVVHNDISEQLMVKCTFTLFTINYSPLTINY